MARVGSGSSETIQAAAHPALEVLSIGVWDGPPFSLASLTGLPRLRTLTACPGTPADPLEIVGLTGLEFLELGAQEWRVLLDAGAVPHILSAAAIKVRDQDHLPVVAIANEILALWDRPQIVQTLFEGDLGPAAYPGSAALASGGGTSGARSATTYSGLPPPGTSPRSSSVSRGWSRSSSAR